jgi:hypothetical protein
MPRSTHISPKVADKSFWMRRNRRGRVHIGMQRQRTWHHGFAPVPDGGSIVGVAHFATRAVSAISRPTIGKDFSDLMALGCQVITRFDDAESVYLTFDDSPNPTSTLSILNELAKQELHATFFCIGWRAIQYPDLVRKIWSAATRSETTR